MISGEKKKFSIDPHSTLLEKMVFSRDFVKVVGRIRPGMSYVYIRSRLKHRFISPSIFV